jgi:hypothetical protein
VLDHLGNRAARVDRHDGDGVDAGLDQSREPVGDFRLGAGQAESVDPFHRHHFFQFPGRPVSVADVGHPTGDGLGDLYLRE